MTTKGINVTGHLWDLGNKMGYYTEAKSRDKGTVLKSSVQAVRVNH